MAGAQHRVIVPDQLQDLLKLRNDLAVLHHVHAACRGLAQLFQVVPGGGGRQPYHLCPQLQCVLHSHRVDAADAAVEHHGAEHGEVILPMDPLIVSVCQIGPVGGVAQMGLDDNGPGPHPDGCVTELEIIVCPGPQVRICVDVHVDHALHGYFPHEFVLLCVSFSSENQIPLVFLADLLYNVKKPRTMGNPLCALSVYPILLDSFHRNMSGFCTTFTGGRVWN